MLFLEAISFAYFKNSCSAKIRKEIFVVKFKTKPIKFKFAYS